MPETTRRIAAVDTDFLLHLTETRGVPQLFDAIVNFFDGAGYRPYMNAIVKRAELINCKDIVTKLFSERVVIEHDFVDSLSSAKRDYYANIVQQCYIKLHGRPYTYDVFTHWARRESLGEMHSVAMCLLFGYDIFLSDDGDAKFIAEYIRNHTVVTVLSRAEALEKVDSISREMRRRLGHQHSD